ncbi:MAG: cysteine desulfurase NifS [Spirochaetota bacterium]|nr:cysteine desulfurase NifS [Spirochaetota bacterium]
MRQIYLDYAATTPTAPEVVKAMKPYYTEIFGNPSSLYSYGQEARRSVEESREGIASFIGADISEIIFTSGGTESNNFALKGIAYANRGKGNHIITSQIEHHSITETCKHLEKDGFRITWLPVDSNGLVDPDNVKNSITDSTILISIMHGNNEIGTIQPIKEIASIAREGKIYIHTDTVQTFGHLPINIDEFGVDILSASAHKLYGPKGIGAMYLRKGTKIIPFLHGGDQERKRRASTENLPGIIGFSKAVELASHEMHEEGERLTMLRDKLIEGIIEKIEDTSLNGHPVNRLPNNINMTISYVEGESMILNLDMEGIACSTGSACTSSSLEASHVLLAIGLPPELAHGSLRFSLGRWTEEKDIDYLLEVMPGIVERLRSMSPLYTK